MIKVYKKVGLSIIWIFLLMLTIGSIAMASDLGPHGRRGKHRNLTVPVSEPAAIALLGAGLVSLGIYAKKKRGKKQ